MLCPQGVSTGLRCSVHSFAPCASPLCFSGVPIRMQLDCRRAASALAICYPGGTETLRASCCLEDSWENTTRSLTRPSHPQRGPSVFRC